MKRKITNISFAPGQLKLTFVDEFMGIVKTAVFHLEQGVWNTKECREFDGAIREVLADNVMTEFIDAGLTLEGNTVVCDIMIQGR